MKPAYNPRMDSNPKPASEASTKTSTEVEQNSYAAETIIGQDKRRTVRLYTVQWYGCWPQDDTVEPGAHILITSSWHTAKDYEKVTKRCKCTKIKRRLCEKRQASGRTAMEKNSFDSTAATPLRRLFRVRCELMPFAFSSYDLTPEKSCVSITGEHTDNLLVIKHRQLAPFRLRWSCQILLIIYSVIHQSQLCLSSTETSNIKSDNQAPSLEQTIQRQRCQVHQRSTAKLQDAHRAIYISRTMHKRSR